MDAVPVLDLLDSVINVLHFPMNGALGNWLPNKQTKTYIKRDGLELIHVDDVSANAQSCRSGTMIYIHKIRKHELRRSSKEVQWWDTCPSPTKLHMIGCLTGSTWTRRSRSNTSTPNTNSQTYWQTEISHVMNVTIFSVRFNISNRSSVCCFETSCPTSVSKRLQEGEGQKERVMAKSKPMITVVSMAKFPQMMSWKACASYENGSGQLKPCWGLYEMEILPKVSKVKRTPDQKFKSRNFQARNGSRQEQRWIIAGAKAVLKKDEEKFHQWRAAGQCSKGDNCSFRHDGNQSGKSLVVLSRRKMVKQIREASHRLESDWDVYQKTVRRHPQR